jgi:hypothetical protein
MPLLITIFINNLDQHLEHAGNAKEKSPTAVINGDCGIERQMPLSSLAELPIFPRHPSPFFHLDANRHSWDTPAVTNRSTGPAGDGASLT